VAPAGGEDARTGRLLVVEDNAVNQLYIRKFLERAGHQVVTAGDGAQALDILRAEALDCVLMDIQMPVLDGMAATRAIRAGEAGPPDVPVVALTAYAMKGDRERFLAAGMDACVSKPVDSAELLAVVQAALAGTLSRGADTGESASHRPDAEEQPLLDRQAALERTQGDADLADQLLDVYLRQVPENSRRLRDAAAAGDLEALAHTAHALKSASLQVGALRANALAAALERAVGRGDEEAARAHAAGLREVLGALADREPSGADR
jgi:CheY-like chemotaxis protein/HPt (histidine-containing phosphotransfer) domain-containing protein